MQKMNVRKEMSILWPIIEDGRGILISITTTILFEGIGCGRRRSYSKALEFGREGIPDLTFSDPVE